MKSRLKKILVAIGLLVLLLFSLPNIAEAIEGIYTKYIVGVAHVDYSQEVNVTDVKVKGSSKVQVTYISTAGTTAALNYTLTLYLNDVASGNTTVSFTAPEIPGTEKKYTFTGLTLAGVTQMDAEITK